MASTGFTLAGTGATIDTGQTPWTNPGNVTADDGANAISVFTSDTTSDSLFASNYGFAVPAGSTIDGVEVRYERLTVSNEGTLTVTSATVQLANAGSAIGTAKTDLTDWPLDTPTVDTEGSSSDTWGAALTADVVNSSTFGARITATWPSGLGQFEEAAVDYVQINVHYTEATGHTNLPLLGVG